MKKVHIKAILVSDVDGEFITDTCGEYNEEEHTITYIDKSVIVCVIIGEKIIFERKSDNYNIKLVFEDEKAHNAIYEMYNPNMLLDLKVQTKRLEKRDNGFYIEYTLEDNGKFSIDFRWEEQNEY